MKKILITIDDTLKEKVALLASITGNTQAQLLRNAVDEYVNTRLQDAQALIEQRSKADLDKIKTLDDIL